MTVLETKLLPDQGERENNTHLLPRNPLIWCALLDFNGASNRIILYKVEISFKSSARSSFEIITQATYYTLT